MALPHCENRLGKSHNLRWNPITDDLVRPAFWTLVYVRGQIRTALAAFYDYLCSVTRE